MEGLRDFLVAASRGGGRNFRTLGDYSTAEGHRILAGRAFRSGHPGAMAEELRAEVAGLGLRTLVTFQTQQEIDILGDPVLAALPEVHWEHIPIGDRWFQKGNVFPDSSESQGRFYVRMVHDYRDEWARFLRLFADPGRYSILYHCTAGRDRTGVATVLLLETLRAPRDTIVGDYLLSNDVFQENVQEPAVLEPLFTAIDEAGGIDRFLATFGLAADEVEAIRANFLAAG